MRYTEPELAAALGRSPKAQDCMAILDDASCPLRHDHFIDCMDLWELCCGYKGIPQDKGHRLGILMLREERRSLRLRRLYFLRAKYMLPDMLTKFLGPDSNTLLEMVSSGCWHIEGDVRVRYGVSGT